VILAGGKGTRLSQETQKMPKPLIEIGKMPIIWHIIKRYSHYGVNDCIICCGYKGDMFKEYFSKKILKNSKISVNVKKNKIKINEKGKDSINLTLVNTGLETMTGGRLKKIEKLIQNETFCVTYGDDLKSVNIKNLIKFHKKHQKIGTVTITRNPDRFGIIKTKGNIVTSFKEKPTSEKSWINGGYFVFEPKIFDYITGNNTIFEKEPINQLIFQKELAAFKYKGKYQPMDTLKDKMELEKLWNTNNAYWKI
jgi:glucose-1-phosphate cytidylyltransferase